MASGTKTSLSGAPGHQGVAQGQTGWRAPHEAFNGPARASVLRLEGEGCDRTSFPGARGEGQLVLRKHLVWPSTWHTLQKCLLNKINGRCNEATGQNPSQWFWDVGVLTLCGRVVSGESTQAFALAEFTETALDFS